MSRGTHQGVKDVIGLMRTALERIFPAPVLKAVVPVKETTTVSQTRKLSQPGSTGEIILTVEEALDKRSY